MGYITNFIVYTLAMVGVIVTALLIFKNATTVGGGRHSKYLKIIDSISLGQRKNLYIVSTGKEEFLIAGDVNNTCLISKLEGVNECVNTQIQKNDSSFKEVLNSLPRSRYMDTSSVGIHSSIMNKKSGNTTMMRNLAEIMRK